MKNQSRPPDTVAYLLMILAATACGGGPVEGDAATIMAPPIHGCPDCLYLDTRDMAKGETAAHNLGERIATVHISGLVEIDKAGCNVGACAWDEKSSTWTLDVKPPCILSVRALAWGLVTVVSFGGSLQGAWEE